MNNTHQRKDGHSNIGKLMTETRELAKTKQIFGVHFLTLVRSPGNICKINFTDRRN